MSTRTPRPEWDLILSAAQKNNPDAISTMVATQGVDPNHSNAVGQTALHIASLWGNVESVKVLLEAGADPNLKNRIMGSTPLHMAAQSRKAVRERTLQVVELLIQHGADVNAADFNEALPIDSISPAVACEELKQMLSPKAPAIFVAIETADEASLKDLAKDAKNVDLQFKNMTPLHASVDQFVGAVEKQDANTVSFLVRAIQVLTENGADPNVKPTALSLEQSSETPLEKLLELLRQLYKNDCDSSETISALQNAIAILKDAGAEVTPQVKELLHQAARRNEVSMAKFLIDKLGIDFNFQGRQGMTALHFAARSGQTAMVEYLLSLDGIKVNVKDDRGHTALDAARINDKQQVILLLEKYSSSSE